jgi:hypothetical protein
MTESQRLAIDDDSVVAELARYIEALEEGERPDRQELLRRFPEIGEELAACLDGLDLVHRIATPLRDGSLDTSEPAAPLGDFRILREAGRGGMGVVYEAEQMSLGRRVALKVLPFAAVLDARYLRRFKNEAQAAAHLHHTNIVPVYAVGCDRGVHYYAMQFIEGRRSPASSTSSGASPATERAATPRPRCRRSRRTARRRARSTVAPSRTWASRPPKPSTTRTRAASSTATSSRPT